MICPDCCRTNGHSRLCWRFGWSEADQAVIDAQDAASEAARARGAPMSKALRSADYAESAEAAVPLRPRMSFGMQGAR